MNTHTPNPLKALSFLAILLSVTLPGASFALSQDMETVSQEENVEDAALSSELSSELSQLTTSALEGHEDIQISPELAAQIAQLDEGELLSVEQDQSNEKLNYKVVSVSEITPMIIGQLKLTSLLATAGIYGGSFAYFMYHPTPQNAAIFIVSGAIYFLLSYPLFGL